MPVQEEFLKAHPDFPLLGIQDTGQVQSLFRELGWLEDDESVVSCEKAGEGNMNLTLKVVTSLRTILLKQARPWVEKYDHIPAPWDRVLYEQGFYQRVQSIPGVAERMPAILAADAPSKTLLLEFLPDAKDFSGLYDEEAVYRKDLEALASYLVALHENTRGRPDPEFENREMRRLNHTHIFEVPLDADNGLDFKIHEPGLNDVARDLQRDDALREAVSALSKRYLNDGPCLLHGDFFPGSWMQTSAGPYVIDPEFCFYGDPEFDLGVAVAHLAMAEQDPEAIGAFLAAYTAEYDPVLTAGYAGVEVVRRIIGVAQLPIARSTTRRKTLLACARHALVDGNLESLCT